MDRAETANRNLATYRCLIEEGFGAGQVDAVTALLTEDFVEHQDDSPDVPTGRAAVAAKIQGLHRAFPDISFAIEDEVAEGDRVWARLRVRGTNTGPFMGPATGREIAIDVIDICRFRDGRIAEHWGVADRLATMEQIGRLPQPVGGH